ncbi:MAG: aminodeoxychorismate/anthranilate synthase component II [Flavobacteriales bacterium]|nr:aminodeoxychorismate/anthranilate synthase component II [Flavobacteriales bacterium]
MSKKILLLDSYDSFTYNLLQQVKELSDHSIDVVRNDEIAEDDGARYDAFILSPGPGLPDNSGSLKPIIAAHSKTKPMFGVCLGMQAMAEVFGAQLYNLERPLHGISTTIELKKDKMFKDVPTTLKVGRYHSWAVDPEHLPNDFLITGRDGNGVPMAMRHEALPLYAVQFHPESILTEQGGKIIKNFLDTL